MRLLVQLDELHGAIGGPAASKLYEHAWQFFEQLEYLKVLTESRSLTWR